MSRGTATLILVNIPRRRSMVSIKLEYCSLRHSQDHYHESPKLAHLTMMLQSPGEHVPDRSAYPQQEAVSGCWPRGAYLVNPITTSQFLFVLRCRPQFCCANFASHGLNSYLQLQHAASTRTCLDHLFDPLPCWANYVALSDIVPQKSEGKWKSRDSTFGTLFLQYPCYREHHQEIAE